MMNKIGPFTTEDLVRMPVEHLNEPKIYTTLGGSYVFTGDEFIPLSEPKVDEGITVREADAQFKGTGMTIKDVARHKDIVKLEKRVAELEAFIEMRGKSVVLEDGSLWMFRRNKGEK